MIPPEKYLLYVLIMTGAIANGQNITVKSPDSNIMVTISNNEKLSWSVTWRGHNIVNPSEMGFELKDEEAMCGKQ